MIITTLNSPELELYASLDKNFARIFDIARSGDAEALAEGRHEVDGENCFYTVLKYETTPHERARFETHKKYIDIQIILSGEEEIRYETLDKLTAATEYDEDKDIAFWNMNEDYDSAQFKAGELTVIFAGEPHAPSLDAKNGSSTVTKLVAKIRAKD